MTTFILILAIITALLLIIVAALQNSKKEGGGNALGSMGAHQIIGVKKTGDLLEQVTWGLLIALFAFSITTFTLAKKRHEISKSPNLEHIEQRNLPTKPSQESATDTTMSGNKDQEAAKDK